MKEHQNTLALEFDLESWLGGLELIEYLDLFRSNKIDATVIHHLTSEDLKEIGVSAIGDRRKLLAAAASLTVTPKATAARPRFLWQRRRMTICFFDIVGFTRQAAEMDPEEIQLLVERFASVVEREVEAVCGRVIKRLGDGLLVAFGWPVNHEDEARRAVVAALAVREALAHQIEGIIQLKVGIATGLVLVGGDDVDVAGAAVNLASRLQDIAEPDEILVSSDTIEWVQGVAETQPRGAVELKGIPDPVEVHRVIRLSRVAGPPSAAANDLVGRGAEIELLKSAWRRARAGQGGMVCIEAAPGMGKTRLAQFMAAQAKQEGARVDWITCQEFLSNSALQPILALIAHRAGLAADASPEVFTQAVARALSGYAPDAGTAAQTLSAIYYPGQSFPAQGTVSAKELRRDAFSAVRGALIDPNVRGPSLLVVEDLHWSDPSTLEFLAGCESAAKSAPVLVLVTSRDQVEPALSGWHPDACLALSELSLQEARALVAAMSNSALDPDTLESVLTRGNGVPLFLTELSHALIKSGEEGRSAHENRSNLPIRLRDLLTARIDRLGVRRDLALAGACIGRKVEVELLARIVDMPNTAVRRDLTVIAQEGLMEPEGDHFRFAHALTRDVAYSLLPRTVRREMHGRILDASDLVLSPPEMLARHAYQAGRPEEAVKWSTNAGRRALEAGALQEAVTHFTRALESMADCEESVGRQQESASLRLRLAHAWNGLQGSGAPETRQNFSAAMELAEKSDHESVLFPATYGYAVSSFVSGNLQASKASAERMIAGVERAGERGGAVMKNEGMMAHNAHATALMLLGEFGASENAFAIATELEAEADAKALIWQYGHDPRGVLRAHRALARLGMNDGEGALRVWQEGLTLVESGSHRQSTVQPLVFGALLWLLQGDENKAFPLVEKAARLSNELDLSMWRNFSTCLRGWALFRSGNPEAAISPLKEGLHELQNIGVIYLRPCLLAVDAAVSECLGGDARAKAARRERSTYEEATQEMWSAKVLPMFPEALLPR